MGWREAGSWLKTDPGCPDSNTSHLKKTGWNGRYLPSCQCLYWCATWVGVNLTTGTLLIACVCLPLQMHIIHTRWVDGRFYFNPFVYQQQKNETVMGSDIRRNEIRWQTEGINRKDWSFICCCFIPRCSIPFPFVSSGSLPELRCSFMMPHLDSWLHFKWLRGSWGHHWPDDWAKMSGRLASEVIQLSQNYGS